MSDLQAGGPYLILGLPGPSLDDETRRWIRDLQPGGFIFFGRNMASPQELRALTDELRSLLRHEPVLTLDQEGGRVSRLKYLLDDGQPAHEPPSARQLREKGDLELIRHHGELTAEGLRLFGFNLDLCPVLDLDDPALGDSAQNSLGDRTWGRAPEEVVRNASAFNDAMRAGGIAGCGKHFPGYSAAPADPHHHLPVIRRTRAQLEAQEWPPFRALLPTLDAVMVGHAVYPGLDAAASGKLPDGPPASLSTRIMEGVLRRELGYTGCIVSDDLDMDAVARLGDPAAVAREALEARNDLLLVCHRPARLELMESVRAMARALAGLSSDVARRAQRNTAVLRGRFAPPQTFSLPAFRAWNEKVWQLRVAVLGEGKARQRTPEGSRRSTVEIIGEAESRESEG